MLVKVPGLVAVLFERCKKSERVFYQSVINTNFRRGGFEARLRSIFFRATEMVVRYFKCKMKASLGVFRFLDLAPFALGDCFQWGRRSDLWTGRILTQDGRRVNKRQQQKPARVEPVVFGFLNASREIYGFL